MCVLLIAADQKFERTSRGRAKVGINAVAVYSMRPHLFVTGSSDPLGEVSRFSLSISIHAIVAFVLHVK